MKKRLYSLLVSLVFMAGIHIGHGIGQQGAPPEMSVSLALLDTDGNTTNSFLLNEEIKVVISLENVGQEDVITSDGFSDKDFHLLLQFIGPDGEIITATYRTALPDPPPPRVKLIAEELVQVEAVEVLPAGWLWSVDPFNARDFYSLTKAGKYSVKAIISMRTYPEDSLVTISGTTYVPIDTEGAWSGEVSSNAIIFSLMTDADGDKYYYPEPYGVYSEVDCDDNNSNVNPGAVEILENGFDDDCDPATADVVAVAPGTIIIKVDKHTVGKGGSTKEPIDRVVVRIFDKSPGSCVMTFGVSWQNYESIWLTCTSQMDGITGLLGAPGTVSLSVPPGDYLVIGRYDPDKSGTGDEEYIGVSASDLESGQTMEKYLQVIVRKDEK